jgi:hypothetical protein
MVITGAFLILSETDPVHIFTPYFRNAAEYEGKEMEARERNNP